MKSPEDIRQAIGAMLYELHWVRRYTDKMIDRLDALDRELEDCGKPLDKAGQ